METVLEKEYAGPIYPNGDGKIPLVENFISSIQKDKYVVNINLVELTMGDAEVDDNLAMAREMAEVAKYNLDLAKDKSMNADDDHKETVSKGGSETELAFTASEAKKAKEFLNECRKIYIKALEEKKIAYNALLDFLSNVANVTLNDEPVHIKNIPSTKVEAIMAEFSAAKKKASDPNG